MAKKRPPTPLDPRDRAIDDLINDKNRLYMDMKKLRQTVSHLKAQKKLLKSRLKFLQEKYCDRTNKTYNEKDHKERSADGD